MRCGSVRDQQAQFIPAGPETAEALHLEHPQRRAGKTAFADLQVYDRILEIFPALVLAALALDLAAMSQDDIPKFSGIRG